MAYRGWRVLHTLWIGLSMVRAAVNEIVWRNTPDATWAVYNGLSDFVWLAVFIVATSVVARFFWQDPV